jgi:hypothetical protein
MKDTPSFLGREGVFFLIITSSGDGSGKIG